MIASFKENSGSVKVGLWIMLMLVATSEMQQFASFIWVFRMSADTNNEEVATYTNMFIIICVRTLIYSPIEHNRNTT